MAARDESNVVVNELLAEFEAKRANAQPFERLVEGIRSSSTFADEFARAALSRLPKGGTFFDLTLSHVSEPVLDELVGVAMDRLSANPEEEAASAVIAYTSLQLPRLLHPRLERLFALRPNARTYYRNYPWRDSGALAVPHLTAVIADAAMGDRAEAWRCLLETRDPVALERAMEAVTRVKLDHPVEVYLHEVGLESPTRPLYPQQSWHVVFPAGYFTEPRRPWNDRSFDPTWRLEPEGSACRFGGEADGSCSLCAGRLHHLITVDSALLGDEAAAGERVAFVVCLSCVGWARPVLTYSHRRRHGGEGCPEPMDAGAFTPELPGVAIQETEVHVVRSPERCRWQEWGLSNGRENLNRVGGHPSWVQSAQYPTCPTCAGRMRFALQLDSDLPTVDGGEWMWGSGGLGYVFWCGGCRVSAVMWQCT